jgi:hypothetical protein
VTFLNALQFCKRRNVKKNSKTPAIDALTEAFKNFCHAAPLRTDVLENISPLFSIINDFWDFVSFSDVLRNPEDRVDVLCDVVSG